MPHRVVRRRPFRASFYARSSSCMCEPEPKSGRRRAASRRAVLPHHRACRSVHGGSQTKRRACGQRGWEGSSRAPPAWHRRTPCRALRLPPRASMPCASSPAAAPAIRELSPTRDPWLTFPGQGGSLFRDGGGSIPSVAKHRRRGTQGRGAHPVWDGRPAVGRMRAFLCAGPLGPMRGRTSSRCSTACPCPAAPSTCRACSPAGPTPRRRSEPSRPSACS